MIKKLVLEIRYVLSEIAKADSNIHEVISEIKEIESRYQRGLLDYREYSGILKKILAGRTKEEVIRSYENYRAVLKNKILDINSRILKEINSEKAVLRLSKSPKKETILPKINEIEIEEIDFEIESEHKSIEKKAARKKPGKKETAKKTGRAEEKKTEKKTLLPDIGELDLSFDKQEKASIKVQKKEEPIEKKIERIEKQIEIEIPRLKSLPQAPKPVKLSFLERAVFSIKAKDKPWDNDDNVTFGGIFSKEFFEYLFKGKEKKKEYLGKTKVLPSILSYENRSVDAKVGKEDVLDPYLLEKQIKELKTLISKKKPEIYKASSIGYLANITVRKISIYFIEKYPEFFRQVYKSVRFANLKVLASTYINITFFLAIITLLVTFPISVIFFSVQGGNFAFVMLKTILTSIGISAAVFGMSIYFPNMQAKTRKRSINTNLPFAIDHMSSVIAAGVSPATMFKLISNSREYGEISIEIEKVSNYIEFFGYDILTAMKAVALITPSEMFKEFLDGFVSTIETGGDLKQYLSQKSAEALLNYRLERQKYVESLSTYSDIYTGVLIAAPLFFVTALSLVSVIGGKIGGMDVNTIITIGTYIVIPALNILFLVFLEFNQPEV